MKHTPAVPTPFDRTTALVLLQAASKSGDPGAISLAAQLAGAATCTDCGYVNFKCRCAAPAAPAAPAVPADLMLAASAASSAWNSYWQGGRAHSAAVDFAQAMNALDEAITTPTAPAVPDLIPPDALFVCGQMGANVTRVRAESAAPAVPAASAVRAPSPECNPSDICAGCRCAYRYAGDSNG